MNDPATERYEALRAAGVDEEGAFVAITGERQVGLSGIRLRPLHLWDEWEPEACSTLPYVNDCPCPHGGEAGGCWECWREDQAMDALEDELGLNRRLRYRGDPE